MKIPRRRRKGKRNNFINGKNKNEVGTKEMARLAHRLKHKSKEEYMEKVKGQNIYP